jgi:hypothetical protein
MAKTITLSRTSNNKVLTSRFNGKEFNVIYTQDTDTVALDQITPTELDSLLNKLNN